MARLHERISTPGHSSLYIIKTCAPRTNHPPRPRFPRKKIENRRASCPLAPMTKRPRDHTYAGRTPKKLGTSSPRTPDPRLRPATSTDKPHRPAPIRMPGAPPAPHLGSRQEPPLANGLPPPPLMTPTAGRGPSARSICKAAGKRPNRVSRVVLSFRWLALAGHQRQLEAMRAARVKEGRRYWGLSG